MAKEFGCFDTCSIRRLEALTESILGTGERGLWHQTLVLRVKRIVVKSFE